MPRLSYSAKIILVYLVNQKLSSCFTAHYLFYKSANYTNVSLGIDDSYWLKLDWRFPTLSQSKISMHWLTHNSTWLLTNPLKASQCSRLGTKTRAQVRKLQPAMQAIFTYSCCNLLNTVIHMYLHFLSTAFYIAILNIWWLYFFLLLLWRFCIFLVIFFSTFFLFVFLSFPTPSKIFPCQILVFCF